MIGLKVDGLVAGGTPDGTGNLFLPRAGEDAFSPALTALNQAPAIAPGNLRAHYHEAVIDRLLQRFDLAIGLLKPVVEAYPSSSRPDRNLAIPGTTRSFTENLALEMGVSRQLNSLSRVITYVCDSDL